jgi:pyruvate,water dikinase
MWDRMVGISRPPDAPPRRPGLVVRALAAVRAAAILLQVGRTGRRFFRRFDTFLDRHRHAADGSGAAALAVRYRALEADAGRFWHLTLFNDLCAMRYHTWLEALCRRWAPDRPDLAHALLAGEDGIESVAPLRSLAGLAERITARPELRRLLEASDDDAVWTALRSEPRFAGFRAALDAHLRDYGDRGLFELKLETVTFREDPAQLVGLVRRHVDSGLDLRSALDRERARRRAAETVASRLIRGPARRVLFGFVLGQARAAVRQRENMRFARARLFGIVRGVFRALGQELAAAGALADPADVFDLTVEEVLGAVEGTAVTRDLSALARLRRREYEEHARRRPADRLETHGLPAAHDLPEAAPIGPATTLLQGTGCSAGRVSGRARVVRDPRTAAVEKGDVLVARSTDPGWVFLMVSAAGLVTERGSVLSHTAIIGRELGIPTVVGVAGAMSHIPDGARVSLDGATGDVRWA